MSSVLKQCQRHDGLPLCCGGFLALAQPLGSFNGGRKEPFSEDPTHFDVQIAQLHGCHFSILFSALLLLFRTCNLASANQLLHPVKPSLFPQKAPSQGILLLLGLIAVSLFPHQSEFQSISYQGTHFTISMGFNALPPQTII